MWYAVDRVTRYAIAGPYITGASCAEDCKRLGNAKALCDETGTASIGTPFPEQSWE